ncbi:MAG: arginase family protein [Candidatus Woesearchaeota archaeon]
MVKILSIPFDAAGLGHGQGARHAPETIRKRLDELYATENGHEPVFEHEDVSVDNSNVTDSHEAIERHVAGVENKAILLGGDHSISYPAIKGFARNNKDFKLIVFDAHPDTVNDFKPPTQEDYLRVLVEKGIVKPEHIMLIGIRNWDRVEKDYLDKNGIRYFTCKEMFEKGIKAVAEEITRFADRTTYISFDIDVVDPVEAIGTGYLEHGGLSSREAIHLVQMIVATGHVGMADVVEVNPEKDVKEMTSALAAKIVMELSEM